MIDNLTHSKTAIVLGFFLILFALETLYPKDLRGFSKARLIRNVSFWPITAVLSLSVILPVTYQATQWQMWSRPQSLQHVLIDIVLLDIFLYFWHRALHELPFLWRFHQVHHHDRMLDTTTALRFHFGELLLSTGGRSLFIMLLAIPFYSVLWFEACVMVAAFFHHSNIRLPQIIENFLSYVVITPSIHWVHHHAKRVDTDANYGTILSCWDRVFCSRSSYQRHMNMPIGIEGIKADLSFVRLLKLPFLKTWKVSK